MLLNRSAKIFFIVAVLLFIAKPFLGFSMFGKMHPPAEDNIFVKVFSKRKVDLDEDNKFSLSAIQKNLAEPLQYFFLRFSFLLCVLFPAIFAAGANINNRFLRDIQLSLTRNGDAYLFHGALLI